MSSTTARRSRDLEQELPAPIRRLPAHRRSNAPTVWRKRGGSAHSDSSRPAFDRRAIRLEEDPRLRTIWPATRSRRTPRGARHAYMLLDQRLTERQPAAKQPGACLHCHTSAYASTRSSARVTGGWFSRAQCHVLRRGHSARRTSVACIDCHDPKTLALRVTRPASCCHQEGQSQNRGRRLRREPRCQRQEMRAYVCGQCHVEYYFKGKEKTLTYPWDNGLKADEIYAYYETEGSRTDARRSRQPDVEGAASGVRNGNQGTHARAGVACADCTCLISASARSRSAITTCRARAQRRQRLSGLSSRFGSGVARTRAGDSAEDARHARPTMNAVVR